MSPSAKSSWSIDNTAWNHILHHVARDYPEEACGILLTRFENPQHIEEARPTKNAATDNSGRRYAIDPLDILEVEKSVEQGSLDVCGFYHSHPDHPCAPSEHDRVSAWDGYLYLIVSLRNRKLEEVRAWLFSSEADQFEEVIFKKSRP